MKNRTIACLIYLSTLPLLAFGQKNEQPTSRLTAQQLFENQRGEVENFKTLVYRYEVAWEESDLQSVVELRDGLSKLMKEINGSWPTPTVVDQTAQADQLTKRKNCLETMEKTKLGVKDADFGTKAEAVKSILKQYIELLEKGLSEQVKAIRSDDRQ